MTIQDMVSGLGKVTKSIFKAKLGILPAFFIVGIGFPSSH